MAPDKSLAAEIEAIIDRAKSYDTPRADDPRRRYTQAQMEIAVRAALQSRAFEDGARWTRERAARLAEGEVCHGRYRTWAFWPADAHGERGNRDEASELARHSRDIAAAIAALPLQPEGERNV